MFCWAISYQHGDESNIYMAFQNYVVKTKMKSQVNEIGYDGIGKKAIIL